MFDKRIGANEYTIGAEVNFAIENVVSIQKFIYSNIQYNCIYKPEWEIGKMEIITPSRLV